MDKYKIPTYEEYYNNVLNSIEKNRQNQAINAAASAAQMGATYGTQAERLSAMGLAGSGYSDYLAGKAYQTGRQAISDINANAQTAVLQQQGLYRQYLDAQEAQRKLDEANRQTAYENLLTNAGAYDLNTLSALVGARGYDEAQQNTIYKTAIESGSYTIPQLTALKNKYMGTDNQSTNPTLTGVIDAAMQSIYDNASISDTLFYGDNSEPIPRVNAVQVLDEIAEKYGRTSTQYTYAETQFNNNYGVSAGNKKVTYDSKDSNMNARKGENIKVEDADGKKYKVEYAGEDNSEAYAAATSKGISDGQVFKYGDSYYLKRGGKAHKLKKVTGSDGNQFKEMTDIFGG